MKGLRDTFADLARLRAQFELLVSKASRTPPASAMEPPRHLREIGGFGDNPGNLRMFTHMRRNLARNSPLVVALHGCTQTAAGYDHGSGWSRLAYAHGFAVLFPEQQRANNPNNCFNWFLPTDTRRDSGEALSIRQMIERMIADHGIDRKRVFVVGLSAGGAMASAMLAAYPDVFAGGAIVAGLPYGSAANVQQAFEVMATGRLRPPAEWGDLVRSASPKRGPWPKISLWHGDADTVVNRANMEESVKQWTNVHGLLLRPQIEHELAGHPRRLWRNDDGQDVVEAITIRGMPHGVPIAITPGGYGNVSPFHFDVGIASSSHIAKFWGIAEKLATAEMTRSLAVRTPQAEPQSSEPPRMAARESFAPHDTGSIITAALTAAGILGSNSDNDRTPTGNARRVIRSTLESVGLLRREG